MSQRSALALVEHHAARFGAGPGTRVLQFASLGFDAAFWELAVSVLSGATAVLAPEQARIGAGLAETMRRHAVNLAVLPPVALGSVPPTESLPRDLTLLVAGEACPPALVDRFGGVLPMLNAYGPTETTVCASVSDRLVPGRRPPIGRPVAGHRLYVLDERLELVPTGVAGELYVGGPGLALGYHGRAALTAGRFVADPFVTGGGRMYRTGDLVRWQSDGQLEFLGRSDDQVKLNGHRVELGEVESTLGEQPGVAQAVAVVREDQPGVRVLVAYAVPEPGAGLTASALRSRLRERLPAAAVPATVVVLDHVPVTVNGKVDRTRLPAPERERVVGRAPSDDRERLACRVFGEVLGRDVLDVDADFFELGGTSMRAVQLGIALTEGGLPCDVSTVLRLRTPAAIAATVDPMTVDPMTVDPVTVDPATAPRRTEVGVHGLAPVLTLRSGTGDPVFCVHGGFGLAVRFAGLAAHLPPGRPVIGLQSPAVDLSAPLPESLEEVAESYADTITARQPAGPYHLVGWSYGGLVAHEVAVRLQARGAEVATLCVLDAYPYDADVDGPPETEDQLMGTVLQHLREAGHAAQDLDPEVVRRLCSLMARHGTLVSRFVPRRFSGSLDLVVSTSGHPEPGFAAARADRWSPHVDGEVRVLALDDDHERLLDPEPARAIGEMLSRSLAGPAPDGVISLPPANPATGASVPARMRRAGTQWAALTGRRLRHVLSAPGRLVGVVMNPLVMLIAVGYLFKDAIKLPPGSTDYLGFLMPGVLLQVGLAGVGPTAITVSADVRSGLMDRFRSMPLSRSAVLGAHLLADTLVGLGALAVVALTGTLLGWRLHAGAGALLAGTGLLVLFVMAMVSLGMLLGLSMRRAESIDSVGALVLVVCTFLSSLILDPARLPAWIRPVSQWNPVSLVVDQCRRWWGVPVSPHYSAELPAVLLVGGLLTLVLLQMLVAVRGFRPAAVSATVSAAVSATLFTLALRQLWCAHYCAGLARPGRWRHSRPLDRQVPTRRSPVGHSSGPGTRRRP